MIFSRVSSMTTWSAGCKMNSLNDEVLQQKGTSGLQKVQGNLFLLLDMRQQSWPLLLCYILMRHRFREHLDPLTLFWRSSLSAQICLMFLSSVSEADNLFHSLPSSPFLMASSISGSVRKGEGAPGTVPFHIICTLCHQEKEGV